MKRILSIISLSILTVLSSYAQFGGGFVTSEPVQQESQSAEDLTKWKFYTAAKDVKVGDVIDVILEVEINDDWYVYGTDYDCPPIKTSLALQKDASFELVGELHEVNAKAKEDDVFGCTYTYFEKKGIFKQQIKVLSEEVSIKGFREYQVCSGVTHLCIPGDGQVSLSIKALPAAKVEKVKPVETTPNQNAVKPNPKEDKPKVETQPAVVIENADTATVALVDTAKGSAAGNDAFVSGECKDYEIIRFDQNEKKVESWADYGLFMLLAFISGLAALLTPCVFPMVPMTVTFFTKSSANKSKGVAQALTYGFSIILIYVLFGSVVSVLNGPGFASWLSTHWLPNVLFFAVFIVFAMSFLGMFEITLPNSFVNKVDAQADKGGLVGVFFMAFTLVLVSFSCTGPIVGTILVESAGGQVLKPVLGMLAFSSAFAVPFTLFAIFPSWLNTLPQSGGWLNSVKVVLGFIELALAFKFLSVADQVYHWGILDREIYLVIWIAIGIALAMYLLGKLVLSHDTKPEALSVPRLFLGITVLAFVFYMIPGLWGAPLKGLSGLLPPMSTQDFPAQTMYESDDSLCEEPIYGDKLHLPHGINGYFDFCQAINCARKEGKPLFIDFTGHGCVNCRKMEENVWVEPEVLKQLKESFVVTALYVDDKVVELPESMQYTNERGKLIDDLGDYNFDFQLKHFNQQAQPYYVLLEVDEELSTEDKIVLRELTSPVSYVDKGTFLGFLEAGLSNFAKK